MSTAITISGDGSTISIADETAHSSLTGRSDADQHPQSAITGLSASLAGLQPLDADLTAIAALTTTAYGRGVLPLVDAAAARTYIGAQEAGSYQPLDADLTGLASDYTASTKALVCNHTDAATSAGLHVGNATHQDVAMFGAGGGQGTTLYGQLNAQAVTCTTLLGRGNDLSFIQSRNAANNATLDILYLDATDRVIIGGGGNPLVASGGVTCTTLTASGILNATHTTPGDNAAYLRNYSATGYGPVFRGGGGAGLYLGVFQKYDGAIGVTITEAGGITAAGGITCATQVIGTDPGGSEILRVGGGVRCTTLTASGVVKTTDVTVASNATTASIVTGGGIAVMSGLTGTGLFLGSATVGSAAVASAYGNLIQHRQYGYTGYWAAVIGDSARGIGFGIDPNTVAGGQFQGNATDFFFKRGAHLGCPNASGTDWAWALRISGGISDNSSHVIDIQDTQTSFLGTTTGTPSATEVLIGGGAIKCGAGITCTSQVIGTDPGGSELLRVGGGVRCTTLTASVEVDTSSFNVDYDASWTKPALRATANGNVSFLGFNNYYSGSEKRSRAGGSADLVCDWTNAYGLGYGAVLFNIAGNGVADSALSTVRALSISGDAPGTPGTSEVRIGAGQIKAGGGVTCATLTVASADYVYLRGDASTDGSVRVSSQSSGTAKLEARSGGTWANISFT